MSHAEMNAKLLGILYCLLHLHPLFTYATDILFYCGPVLIVLGLAAIGGIYLVRISSETLTQLRTMCGFLARFSWGASLCGLRRYLQLVCKRFAVGLGGAINSQHASQLVGPIATLAYLFLIPVTLGVRCNPRFCR